MDDIVKKYLDDMLIAISEIEMAQDRFGRQYEVLRMILSLGNSLSEI